MWTGKVDSLAQWKNFNATVTASGPSIRAVGELTGVADLPDEEFSVSGGIHWEGFPISFKQVEITVGENTLSADGVLGAPPTDDGHRFLDQRARTEYRSNRCARGESRSLATVFRSRAGWSVSTAASGSTTSRAHSAPTVVSATGIVGDPPEYSGYSHSRSTPRVRISHTLQQAHRNGTPGERFHDRRPVCRKGSGHHLRRRQSTSRRAPHFVSMGP